LINNGRTFSKTNKRYQGADSRNIMVLVKINTQKTIYKHMLRFEDKKKNLKYPEETPSREQH
jgi:hypothetical protein